MENNDLLIRKFFECEILEVPEEEKGANGDKPVIDMVFTSGTVDGSGDVMEPDGGDFKRFKKNPVVLYAHNRGGSIFGGAPLLPVGKAIKLWQNEKKQWTARILFDKEDEFAMKIYGKYQRGFMKASSIGFKPIEREYREDKKSGRVTGIHFKKWELAEISLLPIGDNPEALIAAGLGKDGREELINEYYEKAQWTTAFINSLPNSSFAAIEPAYKRGDTDNKNARHLPFKDKNGKVDKPHLRNARARMNQIKPVTDSISTEALRAMAKRTLSKYKLPSDERAMDMEEKLQEALDTLTSKVETLENDLKEIKSSVDKYAKAEQERENKAAVDSIVADIKGMFADIAKDYKSDK